MRNRLFSSVVIATFLFSPALCAERAPQDVKTISSFCSVVIPDKTASIIPASEGDSKYNKSHLDALLDSAKRGDAKSQYRLARYYFYGLGIKKDREQSLAWVCKSAAHEYPPAELFLSESLFFLDVPANAAGENGIAKEQAKLMQMAAAHGYAAAKFDLGLGYSNGSEGLPVDREKSISLIKESIAPLTVEANEGDGEAEHALAVAYELGLGVEQDNKKAFKWYLRSAKNDVIEAEAYIGLQYQSGGLVPKDDTKAFEWFKKAAFDGDTSGQSYLGDAYSRGAGVPKNLVESYVWRAVLYSQNQDQYTKADLAAVVEQMTPEQVKNGITEANEWLQQHVAHPQLIPVP